MLLDNGFYRGACNRAYYATFEAARNALSALSIPVPKTHQGLNAEFHRHIVKTGLTDSDMGQLLSRIERARLVADYTNKPVNAAMANEVFNMAEEFVSTLESRIVQIIAGSKQPEKEKKN